MSRRTCPQTPDNVTTFLLESLIEDDAAVTAAGERLADCETRVSALLEHKSRLVAALSGLRYDLPTVKAPAGISAPTVSDRRHAPRRRS